MAAVVPVISGVGPRGGLVQESLHFREIGIGDGVVLIGMVQDDFRPGRRRPSGGERVASADVQDAGVGGSVPGHEIVVHDVGQVAGADLQVDLGEGVLLGQDPVGIVFKQFPLEEVAIGDMQRLRFVDADQGQGNEGDGVAEGSVGVGVPGQLDVEGAAAAHHFLEIELEFRMRGDILEIGHRIESALGIAETEQGFRDGYVEVFQQLDGGEVSVDVAPGRGFRGQIGLRTVRADAEAVVVGHHHGVVFPGEGPFELRVVRRALGVGSDGAVVGQADAFQGLRAIQGRIRDVKEGRQLHRKTLGVRGKVGVADGAGGFVAVREIAVQHHLGHHLCEGIETAQEPRLVQQLLLAAGIRLLADPFIIAPGLPV